jgi:hemerythrin superfamily protein
MNAIELLTKDHRKVDELFAQIEAGKGDKMSVFNQLDKELSLHAQAEETFFYPELELSSETSGEVRHSYREHQEVKGMLAELRAGDPSGAEWMSTLLQLKESVQHHVKEEEGELFPKSREVLGQGKLADIGTKIQALKDSQGPEFQAA